MIRYEKEDLFWLFSFLAGLFLILEGIGIVFLYCFISITSMIGIGILREDKKRLISQLNSTAKEGEK